MKRKNKGKFYLLLLLLLGITVGYAGLSQVLKINGTSKIDDNIKWDVHFKENSQKVTEGSVSTTTPTIDSNKTTVTYTADLKKPNDFYEFTVDVVNDGTIDAMLNEITKATLEGETALDTTYLNNYIDYSVTYVDDIPLMKDGNKDLLKAQTGKETLKVRVAMKDVESLPTSKTLTFKLQLNYVQADSNAKEREKVKLCKRATSLHTETCNNSDTSYYCQADGYANGETITYGNLGSEDTLNSGDAFDCDVNKDGVYDSNTERFYYVSDYYDTETNTFDNTKVTLIYYNNVSGGTPNNTTSYAYDSSIENWHGPQTLAPQLPTITQWNNEKIIKPGSQRQIRNEKGTTTTNDGSNTISKFNYSNYAARLLTTQELEKACRIKVGSYTDGKLKNCKYLMENTSYSSSNSDLTFEYWLESPHSSHSYHVWFVSSYGRNLYSDYADISIGNGVRPAITCPKYELLN